MRRHLLVVPLALLAAATLTGCGAGARNAQYRESISQDAANAQRSGVAVRNAFVKAPAAQGATAEVVATLATLDQGLDDVLIGVSSPLSSSPSLMQGGQPVGAVAVDGNGATVVVSLPAVSQALAETRTAPITFTFATVGDITVQAPVLRGGILAPGATAVPSSIPEQPVGADPLDAREPAASPAGE